MVQNEFRRICYVSRAVERKWGFTAYELLLQCKSETSIYILITGKRKLMFYGDVREEIPRLPE